MLEQNPIVEVITQWFRRNFSDPEALGLFFTLVFGFILLKFFGNLLMPVFVSIGITYLLNAWMRALVKLHIPRTFAMAFVYILFLGFVLLMFALLPLLWKQLIALAQELPKVFGASQDWLMRVAARYPKLLSPDPLQQIAVLFKQQSTKIGQTVVTFSLATIPGLITFVLYVILVPILVFFFLKDGDQISRWATRFLPSNRSLVRSVWSEVNEKIGAYIRGRIIEMIIVGVASMITFALLGLQYAVLMGALVGISVIVPYIGAVIVTIPVVIIGLMQWGVSAHFGYLLLAYGIIIAVDANLLFPWLFSQTMDLHPIVIILSVVIFGGLWGFWGVFFAIPLATLFKAVLYAWPRTETA